MSILSPRSLRRGFAELAIAGLVSLAVAGSAAAQTIIDDWSKIQAPPAPKADPVQVDGKTTAVLALDFIKQVCNDKTPRCLTSVPKVANLLAAARAAGALIVYSRFPGTADTDIDPMLTPKSGDPVVAAGNDKFTGTNLGQIVKDKGITTVIVTGTYAHGAVLYTASDAAFSGLNVIVPVDGMSSVDPYAEQYVAWNMVNAPGMAKVKLTTLAGLTFK